MITQIILLILSLITLFLIFYKLKSKEGYQPTLPDDIYLYQILPSLGMIDLIKFSRANQDNERIANKFIKNVLRFASICDLKDMKYYSSLPNLAVAYSDSPKRRYPISMITNASYIILKEALKTVPSALLSKKFINNGNDFTLPEWVIFNDIPGQNLVFYPFTTTSIELASNKLNQLFLKNKSVVIIDNLVNDYRIGIGLMVWIKIDDQDQEIQGWRNFFDRIHNNILAIESSFNMPSAIQVPDSNVTLAFPQNLSMNPVIYKGGILYQFYLILKQSEGEKGYQDFLKYKEMIKEKDLEIRRAEEREIEDERGIREEQLKRLLAEEEMK